MVANLRAGAVILALCLLGGPALLAESAVAGPCDPPVKPIACENAKAGDPSSEWDVSGGGDSDIQGFATDISVDQGQTVRFKVDTPSDDYRLDIYRMGYYGGDGARKVATVQPSAGLPQSQPPCDEEASTGLIDCGKWKESASWAVPAGAVSGIYFAKLVREDAGSGGSHVMFVVRDDDGKSDLLFQTSDSTWQAYNRYGGKSLYTGGPGTNPGRAYAVSYNRPLTVRGPVPEDSPFNAEYPMVRWLERNGYEVSYTTDVDSDRRGAEILEHKAFLSVGHDEYWSAQQRTNVEAARAAGVNLAFFSGNEVFWKTRWRNSIDGTGTPYRTLVSYKETHANAKIDPLPNVWTGTWRDPRFSPPADGGRPENALTGTAFAVNAGTTEIQVPAEDGRMRLWRDTTVAELAPGQVATLGEDTLGYEWDEAPADEFRPPGLIHLSTRTANVSQKLLDYGSNYGSGPVTHHLTLYRATGGALVFGAGTIQWSWGLDGVHDRGSTSPDSRMQQATANLLADMGAQPATLQAGLVPPVQTSDKEAPTATIATPADGADAEVDQPMTIGGTAADAGGEGGGGGVVGGVEVSVDGGATWRPAEGRESWTYSWTPEDTGEATILARAIDDSGNVQAPGDEAEVEVVERACPCTIWDSSFVGSQDSDKAAIEVGVKFRADTSGYVTALRFYKTSGNTGTHVGRLWTASGTQLAVATFSGEAATGWQQVLLDEPVPIDAGATYVASYHAPNGRYASVPGYFSVVGADNPPLHAPADGVDGPNGIYRYGSAGSLFSAGGPNTFNSENYLVDVVFEDELVPDTTPPTITSRSPVAGATEVSADISPSATFDEQIDPTTIDSARVELRDPSNAPIAGSVGYDPVQRRVTFDPSASLQLNTTYVIKIKGGSTGVADMAGNHPASDSTWSFTTAPPPPPPPDEGPGGPILVIANMSNPFSRYYSEILQAEGLNEYTVTDIANVTPALLSSRDVAILGEGALSAAQATTLSNWVQGGGNLIAMRPDGDLNGLLGLAPAGGTLGNAYIRVNTGAGPGAGIVGQSIQFHGTADRYTLDGAQSVATLYATASTQTPNPAVTLRGVGANGGHAAAFTYDLARSIVYTRQGNPAWNGQERDGLNPIRSNDLFFGAKAGDAKPDWVDFNKIAIPQADEQQRLLTNLIGEMNLDRKPLPRFWFLPRDEKAAIVMSGDDHANNGTQGRFEHFRTLDPPGCAVAKWECVRATSYIFPDTPITDSKAGQLASEGFEIALHAWTGCENWDDREDLEDHYTEQLESFATEFPSLPAPTTNRTHCIVWSDWATQPKVELENGMRLDTTYYYWPAGWVQDRPGMFTGSGMPMRFADLDGSLIDVYQAATQMTDESGQAYPFASDALLDKALGPEGYYGVFTANIHTDEAEAPEADAIVASAQARSVPVVSARQMLTWLDGRNQSSFDSISWSGDELSFTIDPGPGATGLRAMVPTTSAVGSLEAIARGGTPVTTTNQTIKGVEYAFFDAVAGGYTATYADESFPFVSNLQVAPGAGGTATVSWDTDEPADSRVDYGTSPEALNLNVGKSALVTSHSLQLSGLNPGATYYFRVTSADGHANATTKPSPPLAPQSFTTVPPPPTLSLTVPPSPANQNSPKVVGSASAGSTVRIYTSPDCSGSALATAPAAELATGMTVSVADNSSTSFRATAATGAGASSCSAPLAYVEDSSPPTTQVDSGPPGLTSSTEATFAFSGADPGGSGISLQCRLDSVSEAAWTICASSQKYTALAEGVHKFDARAIDKAGNTDATPATFSWQIDLTSPTVTIDSLSKALLKAGESSDVSWHADESGNFQLRVGGADCDTGTVLDSGPYSSAPAIKASSVAAAQLEEGSNTLRLCLTDGAGNRGQATTSLDKDTKAPETQITAGPAALVKATTASFSFSGDDTGSGVAAFECRRDSIEASAWQACISTHVYNELDEGAHKFEVRAIDKAGNVDGTSAVHTWQVDLTPPAVSVNSGPTGITNDSTPTFTFGSETGATFECSIDTGTAVFGPCSGAGTHTPGSPLPDGSRTFRVRATDQAGNQAVATHGFQVDTTAPQAPELSATVPPSPANDNLPEIFGSAPAGTTIRLYSGADCSGSPLATVPAAQLETGITVTVADNSTTSFRVTATTTAENTSECSEALSYLEDSASPNTEIKASPAALVNVTNAGFSFTGDDTGGSGVAFFECRHDSTEVSAWKPCTSAQEYTALAEGSHEFEARAIDQAGNVDGSPAAHSWQIDIAPPTVSIDSGPTGPTNNPSPIFTFGSEAGAGFECSIDAGTASFGPCSEAGSHTPASPLSDGSRTFRVRATDQAGNQAVATRSFQVDTAAPPGPELAATIPDSPANDNSPEILGSAPAATTIRLYSGADCSGSPVATVPVAQLEAGITVAVPDNSTTSFRAIAITAAENISGCSEELVYVEDSAAPNTQVISQPQALTNSTSASFSFTGDDADGSGVTSFECRRDAAPDGPWQPCGSPRAYTGLSVGSHVFEVRAVDAAGNADESPASFAWEIDSNVPESPQLAATTPTSPANDNSPEIVGSAPAGTTIRLYSGADCSGSPLTMVPVTQLEVGIAVTVADNSTTSFRATATTPADNTSDCSQPLVYVEDSAAPGTTLDPSPASPTGSTTAGFAFHGDDTGGSGVASFECRLDSTEPAAWEACTSPRSYAGLSEGPHSFEVRAVDAAGNTDESPASSQWTTDTTVPPTGGDPKTTPPETIPNQPASDAARFLRVRHNARNGMAFLVFRLPGPGRLSLRAEAPEAFASKAKRVRNTPRLRRLKLLQASIKPASFSVTQAGQVDIPIQLTPSGKKLLQRERTLKVKLIIPYKAASGPSTTWKITVTLRKDDAALGKRKRPPRKL